MRTSIHLLPLTVAIIALGFLVAAAILGGLIGHPAPNSIWPQATENGGQAAVACVLAAVLVGGVLGLVGQFLWLSRQRRRSGRA
jgi:hypothetical protein